MNKKNNNKGFTLVELIVVLVILAILAAILVPALLGYIDRAKEQQIVLNARSVMTAAQAQLTSKYAKEKDPASKAASFSEDDQIMIAKTADVPETASCVIYVKGGNAHGNYTLAAMSYTEGEKTVYFDGSSWDAPAIPTTGVTAVTNGSFTLKQSK